MSGASSRSPQRPTAEATAMSSKRSMSPGQALASRRCAAPTSAAQRSRSSTSVITREEPARAGPVTARRELAYSRAARTGRRVAIRGARFFQSVLDVALSGRVVDAVVEMNDTILEAALIEQFELRADVVRQGAFAATHHDRAQEEMALVDQPGGDRLAGELAAGDC